MDNKETIRHFISFLENHVSYNVEDIEVQDDDTIRITTAYDDYRMGCYMDTITEVWYIRLDDIVNPDFNLVKWEDDEKQRIKQEREADLKRKKEEREEEYEREEKAKYESLRKKFGGDPT